MSFGASTLGLGNEAIQILQGKTLNINSRLEEIQKEQLIKTLQKILWGIHMGIHLYVWNPP